MLSRGLTVKKKRSNVLVAGEFCFVLYVLFFVVVEINMACLHTNGGDPVEKGTLIMQEGREGCLSDILSRPERMRPNAQMALTRDT